MGVAVGIDLGTTNSCVAVVQADRARVIADEGGRRVHPSIVSYLSDGSVVSGHNAKERLIIDTENTIFSFKRLLGRDCTSQEMQRVLRQLPYEVHLGPGDIPAIKVQGREVSLPEVSAMMLKHLRTMCSEILGTEISEAVITVPANFNDVQRSTTKVAGRIAGFNVLRILNEPTAAALAYGVGGQISERIAIYDFGGGTFDITIVEVADDIFEVLSTAGDTFLGGDDFDKAILEEMRSDFARKHDCDFQTDPIALQRARSVAERIKCQLSSIDEVQATLRELTIDSAGSGLDFHFKLEKFRFEKLVEPLIAKSLSVCQEALKLAGLDRSSLDTLILVGGTTRIPLVRKRVAEFFGKRPMTEINPDEVVAIGAAIQAFSLTGTQLPESVPISLPPPSIVPAADPSQHPPLASPSLETPLQQPGHTIADMDASPDELAPPPLSDPLELDSLTPRPAPSDPVSGDGDRAALLHEEVSDELPAVLGSPQELDTSGEDRAPSDDNIDSWFGVLGEVPLPEAESDAVAEGPAPIAEPKASPPEPPKGVMPVPPKEKPKTGKVPAAFDPRRISPIPSSKPPAIPTAVSQELPVAKASPLSRTVLQAPGSMPASRDREASPDTGGSQPAGSQPGAIADAISETMSASPSFPAAPVKSYPVPKQPALLLDVTPRALGVATAGGFCDTIIERNAAIPIEQSRVFTTSSDNQTDVSIDIYQGESRRISENTALGQILLSNIRPAPRGEIKIRVTFEIDIDGILSVSARNEETNEAQHIRISLTGSLDDDRIEALVQQYADK
ncbi:MAG: Hsp70 family protein [Myxococcota bacterium]|nr:Hsp70 family protein [Myxococcota bacterium]